MPTARESLAQFSSERNKIVPKLLTNHCHRQCHEGAGTYFTITTTIKLWCAPGLHHRHAKHRNRLLTPCAHTANLGPMQFGIVLYVRDAASSSKPIPVSASYGTPGVHGMPRNMFLEPQPATCQASCFVANAILSVLTQSHPSSLWNTKGALPS